MTHCDRFPVDYPPSAQNCLSDATIEDTFAKLFELVQSLDEERRRAADEGLHEDELARFDVLKKDKPAKAEREKAKQGSYNILESLRELLAPLEQWTEKEQTQAEVETLILDNLSLHPPSPPFTDEYKREAAKMVYRHVWQQSVSGLYGAVA